MGHSMAAREYMDKRLSVNPALALAPKPWWGAATAENPARAFNVLQDACRLRVEDSYCARSDVVGSYADGTTGGTRETKRYWAAFVRGAKDNGALPPWWTESHTQTVTAMALDKEDGNYCLFSAQEQKDLAERWGRDM